MNDNKKFELSDLTKDRGALIPLRDDLNEKDRLDVAIKDMAKLVSSTGMVYNLAKQKLTRGLLLADPNFTREEAERIASKFLNKVGGYMYTEVLKEAGANFVTVQETQDGTEL